MFAPSTITGNSLQTQSLFQWINVYMSSAWGGWYKDYYNYHGEVIPIPSMGILLGNTNMIHVALALMGTCCIKTSATPAEIQLHH